MDGAAGARLATSVLLALLTMFGPISLDLYLPLLPDLADSLGTTPGAASLTMTSCLVGLACGQFLAGPLADRFGRRRTALVGVGCYVLASAACVAAPSLWALVAVRFLQGCAGSAGIVVAQAAGRDLYAGAQLARYYGRIGVLGGLSAIAGPIAGGQLAALTDWRGVFVLLAVVGAVILLATLVGLPETLPRSRRSAAGLRTVVRNYRTLLSDRRFVLVVAVIGLTSAALFGYVAGATFVLQEQYGMSPQAYSVVFALGSVGFISLAYLAGRGSERWTLVQILTVGLLLCLVGALGLLACTLAGLPRPAAVAALLVLVNGIGVTSTPTSALAMADHPEMAGTAASLVGVVRYAFGAVAAPLVGLGGRVTSATLGVVMLVAVLAGLALVPLLHRQRARAGSEAQGSRPCPAGTASSS